MKLVYKTKQKLFNFFCPLTDDEEIERKWKKKKQQKNNENKSKKNVEKKETIENVPRVFASLAIHTKCM